MLRQCLENEPEFGDVTHLQVVERAAVTVYIKEFCHSCVTETIKQCNLTLIW